jgi:hypothetical protein
MWHAQRAKQFIYGQAWRWDYFEILKARLFFVRTATTVRRV